MRFPGKSIALYIGRGNQYQGVYLAEKAPPSYLRVQDRLLDYVRKYLVGSRLGKLEVDNAQMVASFQYKTDHSNNYFLFGYKERQLFFAKQNQEEIYLSLTGESISGGSLQDIISKFTPDRAAASSQNLTLEIDDYLKAEAKKMGGQPVQKKKEKFLVRKIRNISNDLSDVKNWTLLEADLLDERLDLAVDELKVYGQRIKFIGVSNPWEKKDLVFKKIKKLKKAEIILTQRLSEAQSEIENVQKGEFEYEMTKEKIIQPLWYTHLKNKAQTQSHDFLIKNFKIKNIYGVLGLDSSSNDWIRAQSSKEHLWVHVENYPGSHCILKTDDMTQLKFEDWQALASMIRDFSKIEMVEIPIVFTQLKNIKGIKGSKGEVTVKKGKHLRCLYQNWKEIISIL